MITSDERTKQQPRKAKEMIDLEREAPITLAEAPRLIPAINAVPGMEARKPLHQRTIYNWATKGKRGVVLETVPVGGILVTTRQAIQRFFNSLAVAREQRCIERRLVSDQKSCGTTRQRPNSRGRRTAYESVRLKLAEKHGV